MGGGGPSHTTSTVTQSNLPKYAEPYYKSMMNRAMEESYRPYQTYQGQRLAGMSDATEGGLGMASDYASSGLGYLPGAGSLAEQTGNAALGVGDYQSGYGAGQFAGQNVNVQGAGPYDVASIQSETFGTPQSQQYMSPYIQDVVNRAMSDVAKNTLEEQTYRDSQAATSGAFGGSRHAVQNQMARGQAQELMADIATEGYQGAFENAQQQFERDRAARMGAAQSNQQAQLQAALANQGIDLDVQKLGEQARQTEEQLRQSGQQLGLAGLEQANQSAQLLGQLQSQQEKMMLDRIKSQLGVGQTEEEYLQEQLDTAYQDFVNQRDAPRQNLQFLSSLLQGVPISANQDVTTSTPTNPAAGALGTLTGLQALYQLGQ